MKIKPFRIPKTIVWPGVVILVRFAPRQGPELEGDNGAWSYDANTGETRIYIADDIRELAKQRYVLAHELGHFAWDYKHVALTYHPDLFKVDP